MTILGLRSVERINDATFRLRPINKLDGLRCFSKKMNVSGTLYDPNGSKLIRKIAEKASEKKDVISKMDYVSSVFHSARNADVNAEYCDAVIRRFSDSDIPFSAGDLVDDVDEKTMLLSDGIEAILVAISALRLAGVPAYPGGVSFHTREDDCKRYYFEFMVATIEKDGSILVSALSPVNEAPSNSFNILDDVEAVGFAEIIVASNVLRDIEVKLKNFMEGKGGDTFDMSPDIQKLSNSLSVASSLWEGNMFVFSTKARFYYIMRSHFDPETVESMVGLIEE